MRLALVITTYERPDALGAVLASVSRQRVPPAEILVADDGSGDATRALVAEAAARSAVPLRHVFQPHAGFRLARLRNLAIAATDADYVVSIDGDMLLHPEFIADHRDFARRGYFTQGTRAHADAMLTDELIANPAHPLRPGIAGVSGLRRAYLVHSPGAAALCGTAANLLVAVKGCNQAFWRDDLVRVNGFNEAIEGWGPEDKELAARLAHSGIRRQTLLFGGIAVHLHHAPAARESLPANLAVLETTLRTRALRCARGLDAHL